MQEQFRLDGKAIIVTGGGRGLGRGMAHALAAAGAHVLVAARTQEQLDRTVQEIRDAGGIAMAFAGDMTDSAQVNAMVDACVREFGTVDGAFANAGMGGGTNDDFWEYPDWAFEEVLGSNLKSAFFTCRAAAKVMVAHGNSGFLVTTSSAGGYRASKRWAYGTAKGAVISLTKVLSGALAPHHIRVNCISPGIVAQRDAADDAERARRAQQGSFVPTNRVGEWWEIGPLAVYLASAASSYVTGQDFALDGGMLNAGLAPAFYRPQHEL